MLDLYEYTTSKGGHGHVSGHDEDDARERLIKRGLGDNLKSIEPLVEDESSTPGWPPTPEELAYFKQLMASPDLF
jgi:hypothetical protein